MLGISTIPQVCSAFPHFSPSMASTFSNMPSEYESVLLSNSSSVFNDRLFEDALLDIGIPKYSAIFRYKPILRRACSSAPDLGSINRTLETVGRFHQSDSDSEISLQGHKSSVNKDKSNLDKKQLNGKVSRLPCSRASVKKKNVTFADDCGYGLVSIYIMHENSDTPPTLSNKRLAALSSSTALMTDDPESWNLRMEFAQPITEFVLFHEQLSKGKVALEKVFLDQFRVQGTVRVSNLSFNKKVFARFTMNGWKTFEDYNAEYMSSDSESNCDIFRFVLEVPVNEVDIIHQDIAFAVCFECDAGQFWDNNRGINFRLSIDSHTPNDSQQRPYTKDGKPNFFKYNSSNFSTFNASRHFDGENCYY